MSELQGSNDDAFVFTYFCLANHYTVTATPTYWMSEVRLKFAQKYIVPFTDFVSLEFYAKNIGFSVDTSKASLS